MSPLNAGLHVERVGDCRWVADRLKRSAGHWLLRRLHGFCCGHSPPPGAGSRPCSSPGPSRPGRPHGRTRQRKSASGRHQRKPERLTSPVSVRMQGVDPQRMAGGPHGQRSNCRRACPRPRARLSPAERRGTASVGPYMYMVSYMVSYMVGSLHVHTETPGRHG